MPARVLQIEAPPGVGNADTPLFHFQPLSVQQILEMDNGL